MKRILLLFVAALCLTACADQKKPDEPGILQKNWAQIEESARGTTVKFYMYGGFAPANQWVDTFVAAQVKDLYGITLERIPMDASVFVNKLLTEKSAGKEVGTIDLLWINGENFKTTREADTLFGPYASKCPNFVKYVNKADAAYDFGFPVEGYETPYGKAQFVFEYDSERIDTPPSSVKGLLSWAKAHPGEVTYPQPPDFTGSAFLRQLLYALSGGHEQYMKGWNQKLFDKNAPKLWAYLNALKPHLWQGGKTYPKSAAELDTMFARGEVAFGMSYHPSHAQSMILSGSYPPSIRTFVMEEGSIYNLHFTAIPKNAPNKAGALVVANFLMSPEAQLSKFLPKNWGDYPAIDLKTLSDEQRARFFAVDLGEPTLPPAILDAHAVPEIPAEYLEALESGWEENVLH